MRGLIIGRFQPYHLGHQVVVHKIVDELDEIVIVVGSAQESHTIDNPFTAGERLTMIYSALGDLRSRCYCIPVPDLKRNAIWASHVMSMTPDFDVVFSNNPLVLELFSEAGIDVRRPPLYRRDVYSGTKIRKLMLEDGDWRSLVPQPVAHIIEKIKGVERLRNISKNDGVA